MGHYKYRNEIGSLIALFVSVFITIINDQIVHKMDSLEAIEWTKERRATLSDFRGGQDTTDLIQIIWDKRIEKELVKLGLLRQ